MSGSASRLAALALALIGALASPPQAQAGYVVSGGAYEGLPGERNQVTVVVSGDSYTLTDRAGLGFTDADGNESEWLDCARESATRVRCPSAEGLVVDLRDGDDSFAVTVRRAPAEGFPLEVDGEEGDDSVAGGPYADRLVGGPGSDRLDGGRGADQLDDDDSDGAANVLLGGAGNDTLLLGSGKRGGRGTLNGGFGDDELIGGAGRDRIAGGRGDDELDGLSGNDRLSGGSGNDAIEGGRGRDRADGGPGRDSLAKSFHGGCRGPDVMIGGPGPDSLYIHCGRPTLRLRDRRRDRVKCGRKVRPASIRRDRADRLRGPCRRRR